jgi:hypothetical protein
MTVDTSRQASADHADMEQSLAHALKFKKPGGDAFVAGAYWCCQ